LIAILINVCKFDISDNLSFPENNFRVLNPKGLSMRHIMKRCLDLRMMPWPPDREMYLHFSLLSCRAFQPYL